MVGTILLVIFFLIFFIFVIPISINISIHLTADNSFLNIHTINGFNNKITYKLCSLIPIYKKELFKNKTKTKKKSKNNSKFKFIYKKKEILFEIIEKAYFEKTVLSVGFNLDDPIANSYINASLNTIICMYININQNKFNLKKLYYTTYIGKNLFKLNFEGIIKISLANTIKVIFKEYFKMLKEERKITFNERSNYGRTSN